MLIHQAAKPGWRQRVAEWLVPELGRLRQENAALRDQLEAESARCADGRLPGPLAVSWSPRWTVGWSWFDPAYVTTDFVRDPAPPSPQPEERA